MLEAHGCTAHGDGLLMAEGLRRVESALATGSASISDSLRSSSEAVFCEQWVDVGGQLMRPIDTMVIVPSEDLRVIAERYRA